MFGSGSVAKYVTIFFVIALVNVETGDEVSFVFNPPMCLKNTYSTLTYPSSHFEKLP
jgi:hypothetical protein